MDRTKDVGYMSAEDAIDYGFTGPCLRASGVEWDLRKVEPYSSYGDFDFDVPVGSKGDVYDRYLVRMEEMVQSCRIVEQALDNLPDGPVNVDDYKIVLPPKADAYGNIEGLIHHFKIMMDGHGIQPPVGEVYCATESPNGELGFYIVSDGSGKAYRIRIRPPSFFNFQAVPHMIEGGMVSDIVAVLGSLNIIAGELDR
jgi:NADH:ubiquinone oxidoreductase subunit D